jgi:hypothetical protein
MAATAPAQARSTLRLIDGSFAARQSTRLTSTRSKLRSGDPDRAPVALLASVARVASFMLALSSPAFPHWPPSRPPGPVRLPAHCAPGWPVLFQLELDEFDDRGTGILHRPRLAMAPAQSVCCGCRVGCCCGWPSEGSVDCCSRNRRAERGKTGAVQALGRKSARPSGGGDTFLQS